MLPAQLNGCSKVSRQTAYFDVFSLISDLFGKIEHGNHFRSFCQVLKTGQKREQLAFVGEQESSGTVSALL